MSENFLEMISELEFGYLMINYEYPLESIGAIESTDKDGLFYTLIVKDQSSDGSVTYTTGSENGYTSYENLMACAGRCLDLANTDVKKRIKNGQLTD